MDEELADHENTVKSHSDVQAILGIQSGREGRNGLDSQLAWLRGYSITRALFRLAATVAAFSVIAFFLAYWLSWISRAGDFNFGVLRALNTQITVSYATVPTNFVEKLPEPAVAHSTEYGTSTAQVLIAALIAGTFVLLVWLTYALLKLGRRQLRLFFTELVRLERISVVRITALHGSDKQALLSELNLGFGEEREED